MRIRPLDHADVEQLVSAFDEMGWNRPSSWFEFYLNEQRVGKRLVLVADLECKLAGYLTIQWVSNYPPFAEERIPEIKDLVVLPPFRRRGIARALLQEAMRYHHNRGVIESIAWTQPDNASALRLAKSLGFRHGPECWTLSRSDS